MDKSMVQELTAMAQSNIFKPRQSFISTQYSDLEGSSLRKYPVPHSDPASTTTPATNARTCRAN
jgi:hypothetical protein